MSWGMPVFVGTRVPVRTLLDYLEAGETIDDVLAGFPSVTRAGSFVKCSPDFAALNPGYRVTAEAQPASASSDSCRGWLCWPVWSVSPVG
jgi:hypothetical protein